MRSTPKPTGVLNLSPAEQKAVEERLFAKVVWNGGEDECWIWEGSLDSSGYGQISINGRLVRMHRLAYELLVGPIPEDMELDHVWACGCRSRACANPAHLEPVTHAENCARGEMFDIGAIERAKTHCPAGHPYSGKNLRITKKGRQCRACDRDEKRRLRAVSS